MKIKTDIQKAAQMLGRIKTEKKAISSRKNGLLGGRPLGSKNKKNLSTLHGVDVSLVRKGLGAEQGRNLRGQDEKVTSD